MRDTLPDPALPLRDRLARLELEVTRDDLQRWAAGLAMGTIADDSPTEPRIEWLGGARGWRPYWARTWGLPLLLHQGVDPDATPAVTSALRDEHWRPREMALKVITRHGVLVDEHDLVAMLDDPVARVRTHAARALGLRAP